MEVHQLFDSVDPQKQDGEVFLAEHWQVGWSSPQMWDKWVEMAE